MAKDNFNYDGEDAQHISFVERFRLRVSAKLLGRLLRHFPNDPSLNMRLGNVQFLLGDFINAEATYKASLGADNKQPLCHFRRGIALTRLGRQKEASQCFKHAAALDPSLKPPAQMTPGPNQAADHAEMSLQAGIDLFAGGRFKEALERFDLAIELNPRSPHAHNNRGSALVKLDRLDDALASFERAIGADPKFTEAHKNKGIVLHRLARFTESLDSTSTSLRLNPNDTVGFFNRACTLMILGRFDEAIRDLDRTVALEPAYADAHWNRAYCKLVTGHIEEGFRLFEWRLQRNGFDPRLKYGKPVWLGNGSIQGKSLLIVPEQGFGDFIQFCRYVPILEAQGANVYIEAPAELRALLGSLSKTVRIVDGDIPLSDIDMVCPIMSLALACKTTVATIPASVPYLRAEPAKAEAWSSKLGNAKGLRAGLVWAGGSHPDLPDAWKHTHKRRDIPLELLSALNIPGVEFFSLQVGTDAVAQLRKVEQANWAGPRIVDHTADIHDFSDTAALIANLDLVITVDTSIAHLAGAMGKPVWILNRFDTCWRWMWNRSDSPWYPTARLFRQSKYDDWTRAVDEVRRALEQTASDHAIALQSSQAS